MALFALAGCGDPLVEDGFRGVPLFQVTGRITDFRYSHTDMEKLTASLLWSLTGDTSNDFGQMVEQQSVAVTVTFPAAFTISIFEAPGDPRFDQVEDPYLLGQIVVYEDEDNNGRVSPGEIRGGSSSHVLLYVKKSLSANRSPTGRKLPAGFSLTGIPLPCEKLEQFQGSMVSCGVNLGAPCQADEHCGNSGLCLHGDGYVDFPGGYCVLPESSGCWPQDGVLIYVADYEVEEEISGVWIKGCRNDAQCRSEYECAVWLGACLPKMPVFIDLYPEFYFPPLCDTYCDFTDFRYE